MKKVGVGLLWSFCFLMMGGVAERLVASTAVIAGVESREAAERIVAATRRLIEEEERRSPVVLTIKKLEDSWLVEVRSIPGDADSPDPLLATLAKHYPGMLLLSSDETADSLPGRPVEAKMPSSSMQRIVAAIQEYIWWVGGAAFLLFGATLWYFLHLRRLRGLGEKQHRLEYRQNALRVKMEHNGGER